MTKKEYLDLLQYYFIHAKKEDVNEILTDYEEHFRAGKEEGLSEAEIIKSLGSPESIYQAYISEGIVTEKKGILKGDVEEMMRTAQNLYKENVEPQIPRVLKGGSKLLLRCLSIISYFITAIFWIATPVFIYLLTTQWQIVDRITPLPAFSMLTMASLACIGFFSGLTFFFIARESNKYIK